MWLDLSNSGCVRGGLSVAGPGGLRARTAWRSGVPFRSLPAAGDGQSGVYRRASAGRPAPSSGVRAGGAWRGGPCWGSRGCGAARDGGPRHGRRRGPSGAWSRGKEKALTGWPGTRVGKFSGDKKIIILETFSNTLFLWVSIPSHLPRPGHTGPAWEVPWTQIGWERFSKVFDLYSIDRFGRHLIYVICH